MYIPKRKKEEEGLKSHDEDIDDIDSDEGNDDEYPEFLRTIANAKRIQEAAEDYSERAMYLMKKLMAAQDATLIDKETLAEVIVLQKERALGCLSLPLTLLFFVIFALSSSLHEDITNVFLIESGLRNELGTGLGEIEDLPGLWNWLDNQLVPRLFIQTDHLGNPIADPTQWSRVLRFNQLQGPLVMEQLRSNVEPCSDDTINSRMICYPQTSTNTDTFGRIYDCTDEGIDPSSPFCFYLESSFSVANQRRRLDENTTDPRRLKLMRTEYMGWLAGSDQSSEDTFKAIIYPNFSRAEIKKFLNYLYRKGWMDEQTKSVTLKAQMLNAEVGRPRLESLRIFFSFSRGGGIYARIVMESLFLEMWSGPLSIFCDFAFFCMLIFTTGMEIYNITKAIRNNAFTHHISKFFTILQWLIILLGLFVVFGYVNQMRNLNAVTDSLKKIIDAADTVYTQQSTQASFQLASDFHANADSMVSFSRIFRILIAEYHLLLMIRFFTAFHAQPRLGVVTSTIESSIIDIVHFLVVLLPTFVAYAISGCFIFGQRMEEFSTFNAAIGVCFKMLMEGEYDWPKLSEQHFWTAAFWVWSFMLLLVLLMLNMVLAIVMDVYTEMRRTAGNSETVATTILHLFDRLRYWNRWISNEELSRKVSTMQPLITREELFKEFPGMCDQQLDMLMTTCRYQIEIDSVAEVQLKDSMKMALAVKLSMDKVTEDIYQIQEGVYDIQQQSETNTNRKKGWLEEIADKMAVQNHWMLSIQWKLQQLQWQWQSIEAIHGKDGQLQQVKFPETSEFEDKDITL